MHCKTDSLFLFVCIPYSPHQQSHRFHHASRIIRAVIQMSPCISSGQYRKSHLLMAILLLKSSPCFSCQAFTCPLPFLAALVLSSPIYLFRSSLFTANKKAIVRWSSSYEGARAFSHALDTPWIPSSMSIPWLIDKRKDHLMMVSLVRETGLEPA